MPLSPTPDGLPISLACGLPRVAAEAVGHDPHHDLGEVRSLLYEEPEAALVDHDELRVGLRDRGRRARLAVDERHLAEHAARLHRLEGLLPVPQRDAAVTDEEEPVAVVSLADEGVA